MRKVNCSTDPTIRFPGEKCKEVVVVHCREAISYTKTLDNDDEVVEYRTDVELTGWKEKISLAGVRKAYQEYEWTSDFVITYSDHRVAVRELVKKADLAKRAVVEKLEISRRYWSAQNVDWGVIVIDE